jgi:hypothetical protein
VRSEYRLFLGVVTDLTIEVKQPPALSTFHKSNIQVFFADPYSCCQRGTNEKYQWAAQPVLSQGQ